MNIVRLGIGVLCFLLSLLVFYPAPAFYVWFAAIGVSEWGHVMAVISLVTLWPGWLNSRAGMIAGLFGVSAAIISLTPFWSAGQISRTLPSQLMNMFGSLSARSGPAAPVLTQPFRFETLLMGISSPAVPVSTVAYKTVGSELLWMDIYHRQGIHKAPGIIIIHGGSWQSGNRQQLASLNFYLAARGYVVAVMDYRLAPTALFPDQVQDVKDAIAHLKAHAEEFGLDPTNLVIVGRSAGAQIALYLA